MDKKKILICVDWYTPGFKAGGPIRSVSNMVNALKADYEFYILTSAYDLGEQKPYSTVLLNQWHDQEGVFIKYLDRTLLNYPTITSNIFEVDPDILYLNSLFSKHFTLFPLRYARKQGLKVILAPRGMLGMGALQIKQGKKQIFLSVAKVLGWYNNVVWHASTEEERFEIKKAFGNHAKVKIAQNIPVKQGFSLAEVLELKNERAITFVFISRITKIKNLHLAINALKELVLDKEVIFDIYGSVEDRVYFEMFKMSLGKVSKLLSINYRGEAQPDDVPSIMAKADYMVLPSQNENFGHTIVEAWANGCPVIISQNTPWHQLEEKNIGWDVDLSQSNALRGALNQAVNVSFEDYKVKVEASYKFFTTKVMNQHIIDHHHKLLEE